MRQKTPLLELQAASCLHGRRDPREPVQYLGCSRTSNSESGSRATVPQFDSPLEGSVTASAEAPRSSSALATFVLGTRQPGPARGREGLPPRQDARGLPRRAGCFETVSH